MRMRLGLLQDTAAIDRQVEREVAEAASKRRSIQPPIPTVPTLEDVQAEEVVAKKVKKSIAEKVKSEEKKKEERRIRPLSEAKAIDSGATFISEAFLFLVAASLIGFESWRNRRKAVASREAVEERLDKLEGEVKRVEQEKKGLEGRVERLKGELEKKIASGEVVVGPEKTQEVPKKIAHPQSHPHPQPQQHKPKRKEEHPPKSVQSHDDQPVKKHTTVSPTKKTATTDDETPQQKSTTHTTKKADAPKRTEQQQKNNQQHEHEHDHGTAPRKSQIER